jgi:acetone carboxylase beta subunit
MQYYGQLNDIEIVSPRPELGEGAPAPKEMRKVHWGDGFAETDVFQLENVRASNTIDGPAVLESPATTFTVPPGRSATLDTNQIFHLSSG